MGDILSFTLCPVPGGRPFLAGRYGWILDSVHLSPCQLVLPMCVRLAGWRLYWFAHPSTKPVLLPIVGEIRVACHRDVGCPFIWSVCGAIRLLLRPDADMGIAPPD